MLSLLKKVFRAEKTVISAGKFLGDEELEEIGQKLKEKVNSLYKGSLAIREVDAGSTNAEEQELVALSNAYYDVARFGIKFVASPRHADVLMVTGPVSRNMRQALVRTYEATPDPKIVIAVGDDAIDGGIFRGSYAAYDGVKNVIPVDLEIPGDPPSPTTILRYLIHLLEAQK